MYCVTASFHLFWSNDVTKHKNSSLCSDKLLTSYTRDAHRNMLIVTLCERCYLMFTITAMC